MVEYIILTFPDNVSGSCRDELLALLYHGPSLLVRDLGDSRMLVSVPCYTKEWLSLVRFYDLLLLQKETSNNALFHLCSPRWSIFIYSWRCSLLVCADYKEKGQALYQRKLQKTDCQTKNYLL